MPDTALAERRERVTELVRHSILLSDMEKHALAERVAAATNADALERMRAHLENEKRFIVDFLKTVAKNDETGQTAKELQQGMRLAYAERRRELELEEARENPPADLSQVFFS